ncbi:hypothetical protein ACFQH9_00985 [Pseudonocardia lutea]|uniref:Uncharacterized protein n=1 Tax=Pseudonocardia lutea TaxID=2172015 RepID=A0ABW1I209_9PSEU
MTAGTAQLRDEVALATGTGLRSGPVTAQRFVAERPRVVRRRLRADDVSCFVIGRVFSVNDGFAA